MNPKLILALATLAACSTTAVRAADTHDVRTLRVVTSTSDTSSDADEPATFLGVETVPANATLASQLGLPKGSGLVVRAVVPKSAASEVLKQHDILTKFDDQLLVEPRQLSVLIRAHKPGDEVTVTYLRGGKEGTAKVKLGVREKGGRQMGFRAGPSHEEFFVAGEAPPPPPMPPHVVASIRRAEGGAPHPTVRHFAHLGESGPAATAIDIENGKFLFTDDQGTLELEHKDGKKHLLAKDAQGKLLFNGPVDTEEQRKAMPEPVLKRLNEMQALDHLTFNPRAPRTFAIPAPQAMSHPLPAPEMESAGPAL